MSSENLNGYKQPLAYWANWIFWGAADEIGVGWQLQEAGFINLWRKRLADRREWTLSERQALATVAALTRHRQCDQGHDAVNREIVLGLTS
jgi:hypothetical protein